MPHKRKQSPDAPTSIRLSPDLKEALREEGRLEQREMGGPPRSLHYVIITALKQFVAGRQKQRAANTDLMSGA